MDYYYLWGLNCKRLKILQQKAVRVLAYKPYISHSTPIFKVMKIPQLEDLYTMQLYKLYYKNTNNLLTSYFSSFTPFYKNLNHNLRYNILRLSKTRHEYFVQCTKYQLLKLIRETPQDDLNRCTQLNIIQFSAYFKYSLINNYNPLRNFKKMLCLWMTSLSLDGFVQFIQHYYIYKYILHRFTHTCFTLIIPLPLYHTAHLFH